MAEITIRAKNLRTLLQQAKDLHTRNVTLIISRGKLTAFISGSDNKGKATTASISINQEEKDG